MIDSLEFDILIDIRRVLLKTMDETIAENCIMHVLFTKKSSIEICFH